MARCIYTVALVLLILRSSLYAQYWESTRGPRGDVMTSMAANANSDLFVATSTLHRSTDHGYSWKQLARGIEIQDGNGYSSKVVCSGDRIVFLLTPAQLL